MRKHKSYHESLIEDLKDPREASAYLNAVLEEEDKEHFLIALRNVIEAQGGIGRLARHSKLNRENLYKMLSKHGNPEIDSLERILRAIGLRISVEVDDVTKTRKAA